MERDVLKRCMVLEYFGVLDGSVVGDTGSDQLHFTVGSFLGFPRGGPGCQIERR